MLLTVFISIQIMLMIVFGFFLIYLAFLTLLAFLYKKKKTFFTIQQRKFAVIVPAHDEALVIGRTLQSLNELEYPHDRYDVIVVADNCTDETAVIALQYNVKVFERNIPELRGKGYALRWCFDQLLTDRRSYEAVVVIDADSVVNRDFLTVMNYYLESGAKAIQCSDLAEQEPKGWTIEMIQLSFLLYNFVRPLGRAVIGCSAGLKGNGMCFAIDVLSDVPWSSFSVNEDLEFGLELLMHGIPIQFAPEAKLFATMPQNADNARSQRVRWETGRFPVIKKYSSLLITNAFKRRSFILFDAFIELVTPSLVNMLVVSSGMVLMNVTIYLLGIKDGLFFAVIWISILSFGFVHITIGIVAGNGKISSFKSLLYIPKYVWWKLTLFKSVSRKRDNLNEWVRTTREFEFPKISKKDSNNAEKKYNFLFVSAPFSGIEVFMRNLYHFVTTNNYFESQWIWLDRKLQMTSYKQFVFDILPWTLKAGYFTYLKIRGLDRKGEKIDAAFFNHITPIIMLKKFRKRIPIILSLDTTPRMLGKYSDYYHHANYFLFSDFIKKQSFNLTQKVYLDVAYILAWSNIVKKSLIEDYNISEEKIVVIPPGIDVVRWNIGNKNLRSSRKGLKILFVGGEFLRKGGDILLEVAHDKRFQNFEFHFVTKTFVGKKGPNIFIYNDILPNSDRILKLYHDSDLLILPTRADFSPTNTICEAMATGLPVVSTNVGGLDEIVRHGITGYIIDVGSRASLETAIEYLANNDEKRTTLGINARKLIEEQFNILSNAAKMMSYLRLAADHQSHKNF